MSLLTIFAFSSLATAQVDPEGTPDFMTISCGTNVYPGSGTVAVNIDLIFHSDNTAGNKIAGMALPFAFTGAHIVSIDTTDAVAYGGTPVAAWGIRTITKEFNLDPTIGPPWAMTYGLGSFSGGVTGTFALVHFKIMVDDTGTICIDTTHTGTITDPSFVTELAVGFIPGAWNPGTVCCEVTPYQNQAPVVDCGPSHADFVGTTFNSTILANDPDPVICSNITASSFHFLDSLGNDLLLGDNVFPCGSGTGFTGALGSPNVSQTFNWNTTGCVAGKWLVVFTYTDECGASGADTCAYTLKTSCAFVTIGEVTTDPGNTVDLPVLLKANEAIGGFNFCIEFDQVSLNVISVSRGALINAVDNTGKFVWHYFDYRLNPSTVIHKFKVCVVGIGKLYAYDGMCLPGNGIEGTLFTIKFSTSKDQNLRCFRIPVYFEWDDFTCLENTLSDCTGNTLFVSNDTLQYNPRICGLGGKNKVVTCAQFNNGGVIFRCGHDVDPVIVGDINVNGFAYEVADAVLFASYFLNGPSVFMGGDTGLAQIGATDINRDGTPLTIADLVYMLRILVGDQAPLGASVAPTTGVSVKLIGHIVNVTTPEALGAALFVFKGEGKVAPIAEGLTIQWKAANGETRVLVYGTAKGAAIKNGDLFSINGDVTPIKVEAATYFGNPISVDVAGALPTSFALLQNYPNPFNATTQISFALPQDSKVSLKIYNVAG